MNYQKKVISISGIDGCGKTTIIDGLRKWLSEHGEESNCVWLRYNHYLTKALLALCRVLGLTKYENNDGFRIGYHEFSRSKIVSILFILFTYIDTLIVSTLRVYIPAILNRKIIICDRWIFDIMVDLEVDTKIPFIQGGVFFSTFMRLIPNYCECFVVKRDIPHLTGARPENSRDKNFPVRLKLYERHSQNSQVSQIDNNGSVQKVVDEIISCIGLSSGNYPGEKI